MPDPVISLRAFWARFIRAAAQFSAGGSWTDLLPAQTRRNLRWFWLDGLFASASDNAIVTYQTLFILALGATNAQIGLLSSLSALSGVIILLPGALLAERSGKRKEIALYAGGIFGRLILPLMMLIPVLFSGSTAIYVALALAILRDTLNNLGLPAWISLSADLVPLSWRGRYFGSRNFIMGVTGMIATLLVGELITRSGGVQGYQLSYGIAFVIGMISTYSFSRIQEPASTIPVQESAPLSWHAFTQYLKTHPVFLAYCLSSAMWNFSLNISGPFFAPYQVSVLSATATMVGILAIISQISALISQHPFGILADRWGPRRLVVITGLLIPLLPFAWIFITDVRQAIPVNLFGGALWAGYSLASFNFLLTLTPEDQRARFSAIYQIIVALSLSAGAAVGSLIISQWGYHAVFAASGFGRLSAALLFVFFVRPDKVKSKPDATT
jgi:MFS family permease